MPGWFFSGSRPTFSLKTTGSNGVTSGSARITAPASIVAGDVIVFINEATSGSAIPGSVTFSGFNSYVNTSIVASGSSGISQRVTAQYRLADGSEAGHTYVGMGGGASAMIMFVFTSTTGRFGTLTPAGLSQQTVRNAKPTTQTIPCAGQTIPLVAFGMTLRGASNANLTMSPTDGIIAIPTFAFGAGYKIYNSNPANVTVSCPKSGFEDSLASFYLRGDV